MAEKPKKKSTKPKRDAPGVMGSLSAQRPARIAAGRSASARTAPAPKTTATTEAAAAAAESATPEPKAPATAEPAAAAKAEPATKPKAAAKPKAAPKPKPKPKAAATPGAAAKPKAAAKPRATAARRKAAAPRTFEPTQAAEAAAGAADQRAAGVPIELPKESGHTYPRPRAVREGAPGIGTTTLRDAPASGASGRSPGPELVTGAVKAAGQVAQIGLAIGGELVKKAVERLPKP
jgi:hypothetical protein